MPIYDVRCGSGHATEQFLSLAERDNTANCRICGQPTERVLLNAPKVDWLSMGAQASASPEAIDKFDRMHRQQKDKEEKCFEDHGDYGPRPGA